MKSFFTPKEVAKLVNISYRQIQYWDKTDFIRPSYRRRGKYRLYTFSDVIKLKSARTLRDHDFSIQKLRKSVKTLEEQLMQVAQPLFEVNIQFRDDEVNIYSGQVSMSHPNRYITLSISELKDEINKKFPESLPDAVAYRPSSSDSPIHQLAKALRYI